MKKLFGRIFLFFVLSSPSFVFATEYVVCGNNKKFAYSFATIVTTLFNFVKIIVPILFVFTGIIAFLKAVAGKSEDTVDKAKDKLIHSIISAIIIFFVVSIINFAISLVAGAGNNFSDCLNCLIHSKRCPRVNEDGEIICIGSSNGECNTSYTKVDYGSGDHGVEDPVSTYVPGVVYDNPNLTGNEQIISKHDEASGYNYYIYVPKKVDNPSSLPLIVYLHGNGTECGKTYDLMIKGFGFAKYINKGMEFNTYILMPQKPNKSGWNVKALKRIIDMEVTNLGIDKSRISIWGYSAGAEAAPHLVNANPDMFASAVILAKGYSDSVTGFKDVKTFGFYGTADGYANPATPNYIKKIKDAGYTAYVKPYEGVDHDHVMEKLMYDNDIGYGFTNIMDWVLAQRR